MKIYFAGVPGGGTSGDCKRERIKSIVEQTIVELLLDGAR